MRAKSAMAGLRSLTTVVIGAAGRSVMSPEYDAIIVGARCAGAPTAMLLARKGYRVLLVDRATFPSDTISTHIIHPPGISALQRWGLLDRLASTGCPPMAGYSFDFGPIKITGSLRPDDGVATAYCPRRTVLDYLLVEAAVAAGTELRERFTADEVLIEDGRVTGLRGHTAGGATITERARVVVGADGRHSLVAKAVQAPRYHQRPPIAAGYYAYWSGLPAEGFQGYIRPPRAIGVAPTNDGLTMVTINWPRTEFEANRRDVEGTFARAFGLVPELAGRLRAATRETRIVGTGDLPNFFRKPYGPVGRWSGTPATTRTRSPPRASATPSGTPRDWPRRSTTRFPDDVGSTTRWPPTNRPATSGRCRCTSSPATSRAWSRHRPSCSGSSGRSRPARRP
jgi:2-polyprenyl-6-methoxyphenol hydroxylase-like FAD-dependent oxidoreductase